jgi:hypothetical protein
MSRYFDTCNSLDEAKTLYKSLARLNHPDMGGDLRTMQEINAQFAEFCATFARNEGRERMNAAHAEGRKSAGDYHDLDEVAEALRVKIEFALNLAGVEVELMGFWVWLTGNTRQYKEEIKAQGFKWAHHKQAWYFAGVPSFNRHEKTLDEIRSTYGSQKFTKRQDEDKPQYAGIPAYA